MDGESVGLVLEGWRVHDAINLELLDAIPAEGLLAIPAGSRGRTVAEQFFHVNRVRVGWLEYHRTGKRASAPRVEKGKAIPKRTLASALRRSGKEVEQHVRACLLGKAKVRMFGSNPIRWLGYLISHESHHRGQIMLALKQNGMRMPEKVALTGLWNAWISGRAPSASGKAKRS